MEVRPTERTPIHFDRADSYADLTLSQIMDVFKLMTQTYPRYIDNPSREAVEAVGIALVRRDELRGTPEGEPNESKLGVTEQVLGWMSQEVGRMAKQSRYALYSSRPPCLADRRTRFPSSHAAAGMFVLLSWCCGLYGACLDSDTLFPSSRSWPALLGLMATLVDMLLDPSTRTKPSVRKSALVRTRRALRHVGEYYDILAFHSGT